MTDNEPRGGGRLSGIRWPIHRQLLVPMVSVVLLAAVLATAITAFWIARRVRSDQVENLHRVTTTLGESAFPLTEPVLLQMKGLSGAEFVLVGADGRLRESTLPVERDWLASLARAADTSEAEGRRRRVVSLGPRDYLVDSVGVGGRYHPADAATLWILYPEDQLVSRVYQAVLPALIAGLVAAAVAVAIATWLSRRLARPMARLAARTAAIAQGDFTPLPAGRRNDELGDLIESINRMAEQLADYERRVRRQERLKTLGQLGASMAHQLRNAATGGRMAIELHRRQCAFGGDDESLDVALRQLRLMESYLRQFLAIGAPAPEAPQRVNVALLVEEVLGLVRPSCVHAGIELRFNPPEEPLFIRGDPESLRQLVTNLVLNASEAAGGAGTSPVQAEHGQATNDTRPRVWVEVAGNSEREGSIRVFDTGPGPSPEVRRQLFDSFVTTKPDGFGIGLFVARQIARRHDGRLHWRREAEATCFSFDFPLVETPGEKNPGEDATDHGTHTNCR